MDGGRAGDGPDQLRLAALLTREELGELLTFCNDCLRHEREEQLHEAMVALGERLGFEFVLYTNMASTYAEGEPISMRNLTNPVPWMEEYATRGATMLGCAQRLAEAFPQAQISGFAAMRTVSKEADFVALSAPCRGKVTLQEGNSYRHP